MMCSIIAKCKKAVLIFFSAVIAFSAVFLSTNTAAQAATRVPWSTVKTTIVEIAGKRIYDEAYKVLSYVNKERVKQGLNKLTIDSELTEYAMVRAAEISVSYSHTRPNGVTSGGENIAKGVDYTAKKAYTAWYNSLSHYNNMMNSEYTNIGIGCFYDTVNKAYYWVQSFACEEVDEYIKGDYVWTGNGKYSTENKTVTQPVEILSDTSVKYYLDGTCSHCWKRTKVTAKATKDSTGKVKYTCTYCGKTKTVTSAKIKSVTVSNPTYTGKTRKPTVTVYDSKGYVISPKYYTLTYIKRSTGKTVKTMKAVGKYYVKIKFKTKYSGTIKKSWSIKPKATTLSDTLHSVSNTNGTKDIKISWKKITSCTTGYQVQYSTSSSFKNAKTKTIKSNKTTSVTFKGLKKTRYYVRVRTYKTVKIDGKATKVYSSWSKVRSI